MTAIDFPNDPTVGQVFEAAGRYWEWNGTTWVGADPQPWQTVQFDTTSELIAGIGEMTWNPDQETVDLGLDDDVILQLGQKHVVRVKNASGSVAIPKGALVMFAGATGDTVTVAPAVTDGSVPAEYMLGITTEEIPAEDFGFVTQFGFVNKVNTAAFTVGTILYGNPAVPGGLTATKPAAPNLKLPIAAVTFSNANAGRMLVRMTTGLKLDELHNVSLNGTNAGEFLKYDGTKWVAEAIDLSSKQDVITGAATTITSDNLTASRAVVSDSSGKVGVSSATATELGYVSGVTGAIQAQLDVKVNTANGTVATADTTLTVVRNITLSTSDPSGGADGDVWLKYTP